MAGFNIQNALGLNNTIDYRARAAEVDPNSYNLRGAQELEDYYTTAARDILNKNIPEYSQNFGDTRGNQVTFINDLAQRLSQPGQSSADLSFLANSNAAQNAVASNAASMRGTNPAMAGRLAGQNLGTVLQNQSLNAAIAKNQEMNQLANLQSNLRAQDQAALETQQAQNNAMSQGYDTTNFNYRNAQLGADVTKDTNRMNAINNANAINAGIETANAANRANFTGGLLSTVGTLGAAAMGGGLFKAAATPAVGQTMAGGPYDAGAFLPKTYAAHGGRINGPEPMVEGDSFLNDLVDAKLSDGEYVIPRTIVKKLEMTKDGNDFLRMLDMNSKKGV